MTTYSICYGQEKKLRAIAESRGELAAISRLADFEGTAEDVRCAAAIYTRVGEGGNAADLLRCVEDCRD